MDYSRYFWQGTKTRLRGVSADDAEAAWMERLDTPSRQLLQLGAELPASVEYLRQRLTQLADCRDLDGLVLFAIENLEGERVGGLSWHSRDLKNGTFSFGVTVPREHRGRGYAADAVWTLLRYAFREQRFNKCDSACVATNTASMRLHETLGFRLEGTRRQVVFYDGGYHDEAWWGMTRDEFEALDAGRTGTE